MDKLSYFAALTHYARKWTAHVSPLSDGYVGAASTYNMLCDMGVLSREHTPRRFFVGRVLDIERQEKGLARLDYDGKAEPLTAFETIPYKSPSGKVFPHIPTGYIYHS